MRNSSNKRRFSDEPSRNLSSSIESDRIDHRWRRKIEGKGIGRNKEDSHPVIISIKLRIWPEAERSYDRIRLSTSPNFPLCSPMNYIDPPIYHAILEWGSFDGYDERGQNDS